MNSYRTSINNDDSIIFNETNSFLGFSFYQDSVGNQLPENSTLTKYLTIRPNLLKSKSIVPYLTKLSLMNCNETLNKSFYNSFSWFPNYCVDFNNSLAMDNFFSLNDVNLFYFSIEFDEKGYLNETNANSTDEILCYLFIFYPISSVNLNNINSPYNITMGFYFYPIHSKMPQSNLISYDITEIHTDTNFIGNNNEIHKILSSNYNFNTINGKLFPGNLFELQLYVHPIKTLYFRSYMKFQDVLNNTNSSVSIIFIIFKLLCSSFNNLKLKHKFIKENILYQTDEIKEEMPPINRNLNNNNFCLIEDINAEEFHSAKDKIFEIDKLKTKKLNDDNNEDEMKIKISDYLPLYINLLSCKCKNQKFDSSNLIFKMIYEYYESIIDVSNILIKLHQIEKIIKYSAKKKIVLKIGKKILPDL